jgi:hypothetical protein
MNRSLALAFLLFVFPAAAHADVLESAAHGFVVKSTVMVATAPDAAYRAFAEVGRWWDAEHTYSGDSKNLSLDPKPGGCFCEAMPDGGGIAHLVVVYTSPGKAIRMTGALGPLQEAGIAGSLTMEFAAAGDSTRIDLTYGAGGFHRGGLDQLAPIVDSVLHGQLLRLKSYVDAGPPARE